MAFGLFEPSSTFKQRHGNFHVAAFEIGPEGGELKNNPEVRTSNTCISHFFADVDQVSLTSPSTAAAPSREDLSLVADSVQDPIPQEIGVTREVARLHRNISVGKVEEVRELFMHKPKLAAACLERSFTDSAENVLWWAMECREKEVHMKQRCGGGAGDEALERLSTTVWKIYTRASNLGSYYVIGALISKLGILFFTKDTDGANPKPPKQRHTMIGFQNGRFHIVGMKAKLGKTNTGIFTNDNDYHK
eukprot:jgi/Bigna1/77517/fgenesh1_pg.48_\